MPFGEPSVYPGGISYGTIVWDPVTRTFLPTGVTTTIEVLNVLLGEGNDHLTITSTLVPGHDHNADGTLGPVAVHGGITTVHGGGNSWLQVRGDFTATPTTITRTDGVSWASAGFTVGAVITLDGTVVGTVSVPERRDDDDHRRHVRRHVVHGQDRRGPRPEDGRDPDRRRHDHDHRRRRTELAARRLRRHDAGRQLVQRRPAPPVDRRLRRPSRSRTRSATATPNFFFPLANPYHFAGNDVIDASALFAGVAAGALPTVGFTAYGGAGDDLIYRQPGAATTSRAAPATTRSSAVAAATRSTATTASTSTSSPAR